MDNEKLLQEIRENFTYATQYWGPIRKEARIDMRYVSGDPWEPGDRAKRTAVGRPCLSLDEIGQYLNQIINDVRQSRISVKVDPKGAGATDKTAEIRSGLIRNVEDKGKAQYCYVTGFENAVQRGYGYIGVNLRYTSDDGFEMEMVPRAFPNPDAVFLDPDCKEYDYSDMNWAFEVTPIRRSEFKKRFPEATIQDFTAEQITEHKQWLNVGDDQILIGGYWKRELKTEDLHEMSDGTLIRESELPANFGKEDRKQIVRSRDVPMQSDDDNNAVVTQYITNGLEILEEHPWPGKWIPIVPVWGKRIYVDDGSGTTLKVLSLVRLARDAAMLYCYYRTCEAELVGMTPKTPYIAYAGQITGFEDQWQQAVDNPLAILQANAKTEGTGDQILPLPTRQPYIPAIEPLEMGAEAAKRAIQSAMGMYNTSVGRSDTKATSGVAVKALDMQSNQGNFHFINNYQQSLEMVGRIYDDLIDKVYSEPRQVGILKDNDEHALVSINQDTTDPQTGRIVHHDLTKGSHDVTISTGPSYQSQREEVTDFVNNLITPQLVQMAVAQPGSPAAKIMAMSIRMRDMGPLGDEMADSIDPQQNDPKAMMAQFQQLAAQHQKLVQVANQQAQLIETKTVENSFKLQIEKLHSETQVTIAEIQTKAQSAQERAQMYMDLYKELHSAAHEAAMQAVDQEHQKSLAAQSAQQAALQPESDETAAPSPAEITNAQ